MNTLTGFFLLSPRSPSPGQLVVSSSLTVSLTQQTDFGLYICSLRNLTADNRMQRNYFYWLEPEE